MPKNYDNDHENIFGPSVVLESKVEKQQNSDFQSHFSNYVKNQRNPSQLFFSLKNIKYGEQLLLLSYFDNFDF